MTTTLRTLLALALMAAAPVAMAGGFSTTNLQALQGYSFDDKLENAKDGQKTTLTLNHFSTWEYGDSFLFVDMTRADNVDGGDVTGAYLEWHPRLFLNELLGQKEPLFGVIRNWGLAGEINQASGSIPGGFYAYLGGVGFDFVAPAGWVLGLNVMYRYDKFANHQYQVSPYWTVPFALGKVPFLFTGFIDVNGTKAFDAANAFESSNKVEVWAQPQLLVDVLAPFGGKAGKLYAGVEYAYHLGYAFGSTESETTSAPQAMIQWTVF
jgi:nucleoside-specific outer membrane channel protein Tsx